VKCRGALILLGLTAALSPLAPRAYASPGYRLERHFDLHDFDSDQIELLEKLNRADRRHLARLRVLVVPDEWELDELAYSPMPLYSEWAAERGGKAIIIDIPGQCFGAYENGHLVRWGPVSSGRRGHDTPPELGHLNWRSRVRRSSFNYDWVMEWYFNFDLRGLALHKYTLPGRPASHGCVRLLERDAIWIYNWGEAARKGFKGTPVLVVGRYDFSAPPPWHDPEALAERLEGIARAAD